MSAARRPRRLQRDRELPARIVRWVAVYHGRPLPAEFCEVALRDDLLGQPVWEPVE